MGRALTLDGKLCIAVQDHIWLCVVNIYICNSAVHSYIGEYMEDFTNSTRKDIVILEDLPWIC